MPGRHTRSDVQNVAQFDTFAGKRPSCSRALSHRLHTRGAELLLCRAERGEERVLVQHLEARETRLSQQLELVDERSRRVFTFDVCEHFVTVSGALQRLEVRCISSPQTVAQ